MKRLARLLVDRAAADAQLLRRRLLDDLFLLAPGLREDAVGRAVVGDGPLVVGGPRASAWSSSKEKSSRARRGADGGPSFD